MNNKISNSKIEVPQNKDMNDKDYITLILSIEKEMTKNLATALTEASCNELYDSYFDMFKNISTMQRKIYNLMFKKGWYILELADENKINEKINTFTGNLVEIN